MPSRKLLSFIISNRGIEANPEKVNSITQMGPLVNIKNVQKLTGCMAALNRFISRLGERGLPFFKLLKGQEKFRWTEEANAALKDLKHHFECPPILTAPVEGKNLLLYIAATTHVVRTAIVVECPKKAMHTQCRGQSTTSAKYSPSQRSTTLQFRNYCMLSS